MCVTNTTHRRIQAVTLNSNQLQVSPSVLSQRLLGSFPLSQLPASCGGSLVATTSAAASSCEYPQLPPQYSIFSSGSAGAAAQQQHESAKTRPKRRRKPQKPGKTAKLNDRHFVVHNYHDHSHDPDDADDEDQSSSYEDHHHSFEHGDEGRRRGGVAVAFPLKLHAVLDQVERDGYSHVISWSPHGRCFVIHKPKQFTEEVMPKYVCTTVFRCPPHCRVIVHCSC
jgi:HSF-type DNA-binding